VLSALAMSVENVLQDALVVHSEEPDADIPVDRDEKSVPTDEALDAYEEKAPSEFDVLKADEQSPWGRFGQRHWVLFALFIGMCCQYVQRSSIVRASQLPTELV
jgi:hypothetical protein